MLSKSFASESAKEPCMLQSELWRSMAHMASPRPPNDETEDRREMCWLPGDVGVCRF